MSFTTSAAGAPEAPEVAVEDATAAVNPEHPVTTPSTEAVFHGILNPAAGEAVEPGTYQFSYRKQTVAGEDKCEGSGQKLAPAGTAIMLGGPHEEVFETVKGLTAGTEYAVCLISERADTQKQISVSVPFTTPVPPETPHTASPPKAITAEKATFEGVLNPVKEAETGWYFAYSTGANCTSGGTGGGETGHEAPAKVKALAVPATEVGGLLPDQKYKVCLVATNSAGEAVPGNEVSFETLALAPAIIVGSESASEVKATEAILHATINPENQEVKYQFEYSTKATGEVLEGTIVKDPSSPGTIAAAFEEHAVEAPTEVLTAHTTYYYRVIAENTKGEKATAAKVEHFTTGPLQTPTNVQANPIEATTVTLNGTLNPGGNVSPGSYEFLYNKSATECANGQSTGGSDLGVAKEAVQAKVESLLPDTTYTFCLSVHHEAEAQTSVPLTFRTLPETYTTDVASTSATLHAVLDPESGSDTYHFQYGTSTAYTSETPGESVEGSGHVSVEAHIQELSPGSVYHFRVIATDATHETIESADQTLTTLPPGAGPGTGATLPDNRQYELVSPPDKHGALIEPIDIYGLIQSSTEGNAFTYITSAPTESEPQGNANAAQILATRSADGWSIQGHRDA